MDLQQAYAKGGQGRPPRTFQYFARGHECPRHTLRTPARTPTASASVAASVAGHDGAAEGAGWSVAEVDDSGEGVGGVVASGGGDGRGRPASTYFRRAVDVSYGFCYRRRAWPQAQVLEEHLLLAGGK